MFSYLENIKKHASSFVRAGMELVYPSSCPLCGNEFCEDETSAVQPHENRSRCCAECEAGLLCDRREQCLRCGAFIGPHLSKENGCTHCKKDNFRFNTVHALGLYDELLRDACLQMKQPNTEPLAAALASLLYRQRGAKLSQQEIDIIVPVPHHWWDRLLQSHHASTSIAYQLATELQVRCSPHLLYKTKRTAKQSELVPTARRTNLRRAFKVHRGKDLSGCKVLLVDDVLTTGATAHEGARALKQAGATEVHVAVIARGLGEMTATKNAIL